ncbi:DUF5996 family protein [Flavobacterium sp. HTF]|uniref:DUF5996 family protein n=1 Tax=Flavobacterium sp. HTF TaxID=2170732 RepID=UPI000D5F90AA|nr:DUF5996 family protein [Flavobacterium sp. HTF]PWB27190.1 hypothetical protein DCO46_04110 [Flavobacterium sp. HTF]
MKKSWPILSYEKGKPTYETLQLWTQILGKIKLATLPWANHSWNSTLHITPTGLSTQNIPYANKDFQIDLDLLSHQLRIVTSLGEIKNFDLHHLNVADFYKLIFEKLNELEIKIEIMTTPSEIENPIPFELDTVHKTYDNSQAEKFHEALSSIQDVFMVFRRDFIGKSSPIHFFWGGFDLSLAFFSGQKAPKHPGKIPGLPDWVLQDAFSHEVSDFGFWTGTEIYPEAAFYCYLYPEPSGYKNIKVMPEEAFYNETLGQFILPYTAVQNAENPEAMLLEFLRSTYTLGTQLANWETDLWEENRNFKKAIL